MSTSPPPDDPLPVELPVVPMPAPGVGPLPPWPATVEAHKSTIVGQDVLVSLHDDQLPPHRRRRWLPLCLFAATCVMTFMAGCYNWYPAFLGESIGLAGPRGLRIEIPFWEIVRVNWHDGLTFMAGVMSVLLFHEMGHFLMTLRYRVPASYPYFIPLPVMITGTMGAVISMDGSKANRKELFDIGLAGPLAGLVLTIPLIVIGIQTATYGPIHVGQRYYGDPLLVQLLIPWLRDLPPGHELNVNPIYMAGWVGMLITGLNMLPVSQLDGGHVAYAVLGRYARWLGRLLLVVAWAFVIYTFIQTRTLTWVLMLVIIVIIGIDHPPTADDSVRLGPLRWVLGLVSLLIPIFCFMPVPLGVVR